MQVQQQFGFLIPAGTHARSRLTQSKVQYAVLPPLQRYCNMQKYSRRASLTVKQGETDLRAFIKGQATCQGCHLLYFYYKQNFYFGHRNALGHSYLLHAGSAFSTQTRQNTLARYIHTHPWPSIMQESECCFWNLCLKLWHIFKLLNIR